MAIEMDAVLYFLFGLMILVLSYSSYRLILDLVKKRKQTFKSLDEVEGTPQVGDCIRLTRAVSPHFEVRMVNTEKRTMEAVLACPLPPEIREATSKLGWVHSHRVDVSLIVTMRGGTWIVRVTEIQTVAHS